MLVFPGFPALLYCAEDFSAEVLLYKKGTGNSGKSVGTIHVKGGDLVRLIPDGGKGEIRVFRTAEGILVEIDPARRVYNLLPYVPGSAWFSVHQVLLPQLEKRGAGSFSGMDCERYIAPMNMAEVCLSGRLNFPVYSRMQSDRYELHNIMVAELEDDMFLPPRDFSLGFAYPGLEARLGAERPQEQEPQVDPGFPPPPGPDVEKKSAFPVRCRITPSDGATLPGPETPLRVRFSQPVPQRFFSFSISPDPGSWQLEWQEGNTGVTLTHTVPFSVDTKYTFTAQIVGEKDTVSTFTVTKRSPEGQLSYDLDSGQLSPDDAVRYRLYRVLRPAAVPEIYRLKEPPSSATPAYRRARREVAGLQPETRKELEPYFLPAAHPQSYWYQKIGGKRSAYSGTFSIIPEAHAGEDDFLQMTYVTQTGFNVVLMGHRDYRELLLLAKDILRDKQIYERFERLLGRTTPHPGDRELHIYFVQSIESREHRDEDIAAGKGDPEPDGLCTDVPYDPADPGNMDEDTRTGIPEIFISAGENVASGEEETRRKLGATLAHEIFHAFQCAFHRDAANWITESTAVWAEHFIDSGWNTEQEYIGNAFSDGLNLLMDLETDDEVTPYGMYLLPFYLTETNPGGDERIRSIWENLAAGQTAINAVKNSIRSDFKEFWKQYTLAILDEAPQEGMFPDAQNRWGRGPLELRDAHGFSEFSIEPQDGTLGGDLVFLEKLSGFYARATNDHEGPDAPAISFDLSPFIGEETLGVQAIIVYRDDSRVYEDWTGREKRKFCLNDPKQNFKEIYLVISSSSEEPLETPDDEFWLNVYPETREDCLQGAATLTLTLSGNEEKRLQKNYGMSRERASSMWSETYTVDMEFIPWREDVPARLQSMLDEMPGLYPEVEARLFDTAREGVIGQVRKPASSEDPHTNTRVMKYRVTSLRVSTASGRKRASSSEVDRDSMGIRKSCSTDYSENITQNGFDDTTQEWLRERWHKIEVFVEPASGVIKWVRLPMTGIRKQVSRFAKGGCRKRYQNERGDYYYEYEDGGWNDTQEDSLQLSFESDSEERKDEPLDPVWKSRTQSARSASGGGEHRIPVNRVWKEPDFKGYIRGEKVTSFDWRINLKNIGGK